MLLGKKQIKKMSNKIGVFDSGVGGLSVVHAIEKALPDIEVVYAEDSKNIPYGTKTPDQLLDLVVPILNSLVKQGCQIIVVACNTVTTTLIEDLRRVIGVPLIGMEPMVKPAAQISESGVIAVCATPTTLSSKRYAWLKANFAAGIKVIEPDCSKWASMIESQLVDREVIISQVKSACEQGADVIVLGCTHYHWIEELIKETVDGMATVLQPEVPVIARLKQVLEQLA